MEEKKPQELPMDEETTEEVTEEVTEQAEADAIEAEGADGEVAAPEVPEEQVAAESTEESVEESIETEPETEEPETEEITADEDVAEMLDESKSAEVDEATPEEPTAGEVKDIPAKVAPKGLVLQAWQLAVAAVIVVAMVAGGVLLGIVLGNRNYADDFNGSPVDYDWVLPQGSNPGANQIVLPGYGDLLFTAGQKQIEIILPNPKGNPCYFRYTLLLEETGEILYQSPLIAPGKAVLEIELSRALPKGDYHLTIAIDSISLADGRTPMNGGEHRVLLQVR